MTDNADYDEARASLDDHKDFHDRILEHLGIIKKRQDPDSDTLSRKYILSCNILAQQAQPLKTTQTPRKYMALKAAAKTIENQDRLSLGLCFRCGNAHHRAQSCMAPRCTSCMATGARHTPNCDLHYNNFLRTFDPRYRTNEIYHPTLNELLRSTRLVAYYEDEWPHDEDTKTTTKHKIDRSEATRSSNKRARKSRSQSPSRPRNDEKTQPLRPTPAYEADYVDIDEHTQEEAAEPDSDHTEPPEAEQEQDDQSHDDQDYTSPPPNDPDEEDEATNWEEEASNSPEPDSPATPTATTYEDDHTTEEPVEPQFIVTCNTEVQQPNHGDSTRTTLLLAALRHRAGNNIGSNKHINGLIDSFAIDNTINVKSNYSRAKYLDLFINFATATTGNRTPKRPRGFIPLHTKFTQK